MCSQFLKLQRAYVRKTRRWMLDSLPESLTNFEFFQQELPGAVIHQPSASTYERTPQLQPQDDPALYDPNNDEAALAYIVRGRKSV